MPTRTVVIDTADTSIDGQQCVSTVEQHADEGATHVPCTQTVTYQTNPPSSGNHYSCWAAYQTYSSPVPWGNLVHSLEHGAMIVVYNCPQGCAADVAAIQSFIDALPLDPNCGASLRKNRIILMPDPDPGRAVRRHRLGLDVEVQLLRPGARSGSSSTPTTITGAK